MAPTSARHGRGDVQSRPARDGSRRAVAVVTVTCRLAVNRRANSNGQVASIMVRKVGPWAGATENMRREKAQPLRVAGKCSSRVEPWVAGRLVVEEAATSVSHFLPAVTGRSSQRTASGLRLARFVEVGAR